MNLCGDDDVRAARARALRAAGCIVSDAATPARARALIRSLNPDLLVLDTRIPRVTRLVRELRSRGAGQDSGTPIAVLALCRPGPAAARDVADATAAGADACLVEPVGRVRLGRALDAVFGRLDRARARVEECRRLRERDARHRVLAATLGETVYDWDLTTDFVEWNVALIRELRYQSNDVVPTSQWWIDRVHPDDRAEVARALHRTFEERAATFEAEYRFAYGDQGYAVVVDTATVMYDDAGRPIRVVGIMKDVTERRHLAEQLRTAQKLEAVGRLAGGIAHDFNNVLTAIIGGAVALKEALAARPALAVRASEIEAAAESAARLTRQLLAFGSRQVLRAEVLSLNEVVHASVRLIERLIGEDIRIELALSDREPAVTADRSQLEQVLVNLAVNARDAMPNGGVLRFRTDLVEVPAREAKAHGRAPGTYAQLAVTDTGIGMDDETRARVFEPFFTTKPAGHGSGLGLATVYGSVTQIGGYVTVASARGAGSTFRMYLPAASGPPPASVEAFAADVPARGAGETILLVEDESSVRSLVERVLRTAGYEVVAAPDGRTALDAASTHARAIDLLLTDIVLPGLSGFSTAERLRRRFPDVRVLYMSGYSAETRGRKSQAPALGHFVQKPFSPGLLLQRVRLALDDPSSGGAASR